MTEPSRSSAQTAYIALGANLPSAAGPPSATFGSALRSIDQLGHILAVSSCYQTEPVGLAAQPPFLNAAAALRTSLDPHTLLEVLLQIERQHGRDRTQTTPKGPRTLDLDLLLMGTRVFSTPDLVLPHPALHLRRFALAPLAEIAPNLLHPTLKRTIQDLLSALPEAGPNRANAVRILPPNTLE